MIIALLGAAGSGKSTVAKYLVDHYGGQEFLFAYRLKKIVRNAFNLPKSAVYGTQREKESIVEGVGYSGRGLMTRIGQAIRDEWGPDTWANDTLKQIADEKPPFAVISDCRYVNEAALVQKAGGIVWRIENPNRKSEADSDHPSESQWMKAPYDYLLKPSISGLDQLYLLVDGLANLAGLKKVKSYDSNPQTW